jgi:2'-5' RNA ligase
VESRIAGFLASLPESRELDGVRWVNRANLHVTLHFLGGAVPADMITRLDSALMHIAGEMRPFILEARGAGVFPSLVRPRVVWIGLKSGALASLAERIIAAAHASGFPPPAQPYSPHLTIGRTRGANRGEWLRQMIERATDRDFGQTAVNSFILYRSILGPHGASYEELASYRLRASD